MRNLKLLKKLIRENLSDDLLNKEWLFKKQQEVSCDPTFGHCYVATEAAYHILGGKEGGWKPFNLKNNGEQHWFLKHMSGTIFDPTDAQYNGECIPYKLAKGRGFLTLMPSKRAKKLINRVMNNKIYRNIPPS